MKTQLKYIFSALILVSFFLSGNPVFARSLWMKNTTDERGMFSDKVASRVGDILTVNVNHTATMNNKLDTKNVKKDASIINTFVSLLYPNSDFGKHEGTLPSTNLSTANTYSGGGEIKNTSTLTATVSVTVIDVLPNGNMVFEGVRDISFSGETQFAVLRGIVRYYDVTTDNTVDSNKIADAQIHFIGEGELSPAQRKGWLLKFYDFVKPF